MSSTADDQTGDARPPPRRRAKRRLGLVDLVLIATIVGAFGYFAWRTNVVLRYNWNWSTVWPWIARFDEKTGNWVPSAILLGLQTTLQLAVWGILLAAIIGAGMGWARTSKRLLPRLISTSYVMLVRNIPPLVFVFVFVYFVTSQILPALGIADWASRLSPEAKWWLSLFLGPAPRIESFLVGLVCLAAFTGAYVTEIVRAGIQSVPASQIEAGESLGMSRIDVLRFVVFPQALRNVIPPLSNQFIQMIKDSSLVSLVSVQELTFVAQDIQASTQRVFEILLFTGGIYFLVCWSLSLVFSRLEQSTQRVRG